MGDASAEFLAARLSQTAQHVILDEVSDKEDQRPNMLCSLEQWTKYMQKLRIRKTDEILIYDNMGFFSVGRIALMFRYFGAKKVRIINGGMKKWKLEGKPTYEGDYVAGEGLEAEGDYSYSVINEDFFVRDITKVHHCAQRIFNGS